MLDILLHLEIPLTLVLPVLTLVQFLRVFVIGHSSNAAQVAGEEGYALWSSWCFSAQYFPDA